jgi:hypothetical protein
MRCEPVNSPIHPVQTPDFSDPDTFLQGHSYSEHKWLREDAPNLLIEAREAARIL